MQWYIILLIALAVAAVFAVVLTLVPAILIHKAVFGCRQDKNPEFRYFTPEDFNLTTECVPVYYSGTILSAALYSVKPVEECERVVIFQHGFGAGSASYTTEIAHFARQGNAVLAVDAYGCNNSAGKGIKGFYAGAEAVIAAFIAVRKDERLKGKKVILVGHSWGAYSVTAACGTVKPDGVVAMSGFNSPAQCVCDSMKGMGGMVRSYAPFVRGWLSVINFFKFGANGNTKAVKALEKSGVKALLIHGEKDGAVPFKHSPAKLAKGENITVLTLADKHHNPYNTVEAEEKLAELTGAHKFGSREEAKEYFASFDWKAVTEEDEEVMGAIDRFIANA
ncbi:MAG: alpha/beta fold hydrolase [Clostridia bacterium]|nr:alpha/beta fold hydrolase [Clostridia bacterium]